MPRPNRPQLGDRDLPLGQDLEEKRLERLVRTIHLVDEQHRRPLARNRIQQRPLEQETLAEHVRFALVEAGTVRLAQARVEHLARVVPLVERRHRVEAFVALEANQLRAEHLGEHFRALGLADAGRPLDEQGLLEGEHDLQRGGKRLVDDEAALAEAIVDGRGVCHECARYAPGASRNLPRQPAQQK